MRSSESAASTNSATRAPSARGSIGAPDPERYGKSARPATFCRPRASKGTVSRLAEIDVTDELLLRACAGEQRAREAIYLATAAATLSLIRRLVGQRALAEDLFQDTMMTLFERLPQF